MDAALSNPPLAPGTRLGRYEIVRMLSFGGMGELYLAKAAGIEGFEKEFALKRILAQFASDPSFESMLLDEARLMSSLQHPNIVQVFDIDRVDGFTFFTMEYVHGENLRAVLKAAAKQHRGLSRGNALFIVMNVAAGLHYAHEKRRPDGSPLGLIHRDVCPNNIMLSHDGVVKLVDFGVAMAIARSAKTTPGAIKGNLRYMSPEQSLGERLDRRSDVFSLGIVLFELTTGTRFIREKDDFWAVQKMLSEPLPRPSERKAEYPEALEVIVMKALAKNPADRYATAQEFQLALEEFVRETKVTASAVSLARSMNEWFGADVGLSAIPPKDTPVGDDLGPFPDTRVTTSRAVWPLLAVAAFVVAAVIAGGTLLLRSWFATEPEPSAEGIVVTSAAAPEALSITRESAAESALVPSGKRPEVVPMGGLGGQAAVAEEEHSPNGKRGKKRGPAVPNPKPTGARQEINPIRTRSSDPPPP
jgi:serine/threonine protein kinase